ncbi:Hypothetical protein, putative [Bodo saltans]|uniref:Uncharacterized protein n=1 Tax=Bodo saltans TaxID=75058 RepID=A0A0S4JFY3_BODSA|nr:Hypothetical protein, putative [Bodo saltans]|eukprot:CUG88102.1 Hypothetical protein, putative [Bodo saltans]
MRSEMSFVIRISCCLRNIRRRATANALSTRNSSAIYFSFLNSFKRLLAYVLIDLQYVPLPLHARNFTTRCGIGMMDVRALRAPQYLTLGASYANRSVATTILFIFRNFHDKWCLMEWVHGAVELRSVLRFRLDECHGGHECVRDGSVNQVTEVLHSAYIVKTIRFEGAFHMQCYHCVEPSSYRLCLHCVKDEMHAHSHHGGGCVRDEKMSVKQARERGGHAFQMIKPPSTATQQQHL